MRYVAFLIFVAVPNLVLSQVTGLPEPKVSVDAPSEDVIVGQPAILRIRVLVPTFMPSPPVFPSLEQENLLVRLPERASGPISETIDGATWSGVQRSYRIYPLVAGPIDLGVESMTVTFADPETNTPTQVSVPLPPITVNAVIPDGAAGLNPLIIATGFELDQQIDGATEMQAGDAITRRLTARIEGTSPLLIPPLIPETHDPLLRPYPKESRLTESEDRGILSGQRIDEVVYLAQDGGQTQLPPVTVQWYNLTSNTVETVDLAGIDLTLAAPKAEPPAPGTMVRYAILGVLVALALWLSFRWTRPRYLARQDERERRYRASPEFALVQLRRAITEHDLSAAYSALETWKLRSPNPTGFHDLEAQLTRIGASRYALDYKDETPDWSAAISAMGTLAKTPKGPATDLPPLNP